MSVLLLCCVVTRTYTPGADASSEEDVPLSALAQRTPSAPPQVPQGSSDMPATDSQQQPLADTAAADGNAVPTKLSEGRAARNTRRNSRKGADSSVQAQSADAVKTPAVQRAIVKLERCESSPRASSNDKPVMGRAESAQEGSPEPAPALPQPEIRVTRSSSKRASGDASPAASPGNCAFVACLHSQAVLFAGDSFLLACHNCCVQDISQC